MNRDLFWKYLEAAHPKAEAFCRKLAGNREDGDDVYQDALLTALRKVRTLRDPNAFRPWLYRIMVNTYKNRVAELAALQRRPEGTIKARLARARKKMRQAIESHLPKESTDRKTRTKGSGAEYALPQSEPSQD